MSNISVDLYNAVRQDALPTDIKLNNRTYTVRSVTPVKEPSPDTLLLNTLTGLVDYLKTNVDKLQISELICQVAGSNMVRVFSGLHGDFLQRSAYVTAEFIQEPFPFGYFLNVEDFNIKMQACFCDSDLQATDKGLILKYVGNVRTEVVSGVGDDGVSQEMTVRAGIASVENVILPNPVSLRPYRTFNEIEQPESKFVFRAKDGPRFGLFEADNGAWKNEAMKNIKHFLEFEIPELHVIA